MIQYIANKISYICNAREVISVIKKKFFFNLKVKKSTQINFPKIIQFLNCGKVSIFMFQQNYI